MPSQSLAKVLSFGDTPSYIQVGMFRSPRTLFDQHAVLNVEIELQDLLNSIPRFYRATTQLRGTCYL